MPEMSCISIRAIFSETKRPRAAGLHTAETRTLDGSFATLPSVPSIGTGWIVTAVVDMAGSRVELTDCPSSRPATAFPAPPRTRCPTGELALRGDRKKIQNHRVELGMKRDKSARGAH